MRRFVFVLEQTLGHVAHGRNLERALAARNTIEPTIIRIPYSTPSGLGSIPLARNWSVRASVAARRALKGISGPVEAAFIHTQVASLLSTGFMSRTPTVVSLDATPVNFDTEGEAYGHHRTAPAVEWLKREFNLRPLRSAACLVTWCQWAADSLVRDYGLDAAKIQVVHPGVDLSIFKPGDRSHGGDPVRVLFVGGDFIRKGGLELLNAARGLEEKIALEIVTNDAVEVPPGLTVNIHRGLAPQSEGLVRLFRESDLFVLPTRGDCFPQVIGEAMACALPVISTRVGAIPEMVVEDETGLLIPPRDPASLRQALEALWGDPARRARMGTQGLAQARLRHDADRNAGLIFGIMEQLAQARSGVL